MDLNIVKNLAGAIFSNYCKIQYVWSTRPARSFSSVKLANNMDGFRHGW